MTTELIGEFCRVYKGLGKNNLNQLGLIYSDNVHFIDALHSLQGLARLSDYFAHLYGNIIFCEFTIEDVIEGQGQACVIWTMKYAHPKINNAKPISVNGTSHLKFDSKIYYHRDFADMGQMLYEHLPLLGGVIRTVKKRAVS